MSNAPRPPLNVLFLCTHNSARSILAEALLNAMGQGRFKAYSAGSSPRDNQQPHPLGLQALAVAGIPTEGLRSKSWDEFAAPGAPHMDLIITVCDRAHEEYPTTALHWSVPDPVRGGTPGAFDTAFAELQSRVERLAPRVRLMA